MDTKPPRPATTAMPPFWKSPQAIFMVVAGLTVAVLGPYLMWRSMGLHADLKGANTEAVDSQPGPPTVDASIDLTELDGLPKDLHDGAMLLLTTDSPEHPDAITSLPDPTSEDLLHPVSEAVFETQPTLSWQASFAPPLYSVTVFQGPDVAARGQGIANTSWTVPMPLVRGQNYVWQLSATDTSARASFRVLDEVQSRVWISIKASHGMSHLALGTVAEQLGMLGVAEREYSAMVKDNPQSQTAARLLSNVQELRER